MYTFDVRVHKVHNQPFRGEDFYADRITPGVNCVGGRTSCGFWQLKYCEIKLL